MNLSTHLPERMPCLLCFTPGSFERRIDKKGRHYYSCALCHHRVFLHGDTHIYGIIFWSRALADGALVHAARADLERLLAANHVQGAAVGNHSVGRAPLPIGQAATWPNDWAAQQSTETARGLMPVLPDNRSAPTDADGEGA